MKINRSKILGIILGGGKGERLFPLTCERSKPAVPFGGKYRIVDFVLSSFINSGLRSIYVMVQYKSQSLIEHLRLSWRARGLTQDEFITVVPPQMKSGEYWYRGTADAVAQNLNLIYDFNPGIVVVFGADHIYRMDINQMVDFHLSNNADVTVASIPVPKNEASKFGIVKTNKAGRVTGFLEKPDKPSVIGDSKNQVLASMGNYVFNAEVLLEVMKSSPKDYSEHDFGKNIMPKIHKTHRTFAYNFAKNIVPGLKNYENPGYWRDVGTIYSYWHSHMDLLSQRPIFDLNNSQWPVHSGRHEGPPSHIISGRVEDTVLGGGCIVSDSVVKRCVFGRNITVEKGCYLEDSIIMDGCVIGAGTKIYKSIVDRFNSIPKKSYIGKGRGIELGAYAGESGIMVIPRGKRGVCYGYE